MVVLCHADKPVTGRTDDLVEVLIGDSMGSWHRYLLSPLAASIGLQHRMCFILP